MLIPLAEEVRGKSWQSRKSNEPNLPARLVVRASPGRVVFLPGLPGRDEPTKEISDELD